MKVPFVARLATAVLVLGVLGGCSGDADPEAVDPTESASSEGEPADGDGDADEETSAPPDEAPAGDVEAVCGAYEQLNGEITAADSLEQFETLVANAPPEISADAMTLQSGVLAYVDAVEAAGFDLSVLDDQSKLNKKEQAAYNAALEAANVDFEAGQAAATNLNNWAGANC